MSCVYILKSAQTGRYYIGSTRRLGGRLEEHNAGKNASTKAYQPWEVVHTERFSTLSEARRRERYLKSLKNRAYLERVILGD
ncbi:MAG: GIY-YIG nuclease family protein [Dehalococcoidia bacterium]|nr:GIY-YIG nuclease family protein [Dehalococcoidia bacterium]